MLIQRGHLAVDGDIAYVAQQAWIFNATLKENVLFGRDYDEKRSVYFKEKLCIILQLFCKTDNAAN